MNKFYSRKFLLSVFTVAVSAALVWLEHISDGVFSSVVIATVGAYMTANWAVAKDKVAP